MIWTRVNIGDGVQCGHCGGRILEGELVALLAVHKKRRCVRCVGAPSADVVAAIKTFLMREMFCHSDTELSLDRLLGGVTRVKDGDGPTLGRALDELVRERRLQVRTIGTFRRWRLAGSQRPA